MATNAKRMKFIIELMEERKGVYERILCSPVLSFDYDDTCIPVAVSSHNNLTICDELNPAVSEG